jgi:hypothetical protein
MESSSDGGGLLMDVGKGSVREALEYVAFGK